VISAATTEHVRTKKPADLKFVPRATRCQGTDGPSATARLTGSEPPDVFYPPSSKRRREAGTIVVRAQVNAAGCAEAFAIVVSSGYPDLDAAAFKLAESGRFAAATEDGQPAAGEATYKVRFEIRDDPAK
jgi:protein TonB